MKQNIITAVIIIIAVAGFLWWYQTPSTGGVQISPTTSQGPSLDLVNKLRNLKIDTSFFSDSQFMALEEAPSLSLDGLQKGRPNPFISSVKK